MEKLDLKKELKSFYKPSRNKTEIVTLPEFNYAMVSGKGNPNDNPDFENAVGALYSVCYTMKFACKKLPGKGDFVVMPLEGFWYMESGNDFNLENKDEWLWDLGILLPDFIGEELFEKSKGEAFRKKGHPEIKNVSFVKITEGLSMQTLYVGPYSEEHEVIAGMHKFAENNGYKLRGKHHEIYLGDPRKTAPEKLKTILRQPLDK